MSAPLVVDCPLQLAIGDHPQVAIVEPERVVVVELPSGTLVAELGLQVEAEGVDVGWLGPSPRLLVVSRLPDHTQLHLLDVTSAAGVRVCAEKRVEVAMRLLAVSGNYALLCGAVSSAVLTRSEDNMAIHPVAARGVPAAAGALGTQLVVALPGMIELWDPVARVAKRRLKLPRPAQLRAVGGSERQIWLTTLAEPHRLEVLPLVNRGQPKVHELDEPIALVAGHPRLDVVACTGADSGQVYVIDLDGRMPTRALGTGVFGGPPMAMALLGGRLPALVAVAAGQPPRLVALDGTALPEWPGQVAAPSTIAPPPPASTATTAGAPRAQPPAVPAAPAAKPGRAQTERAAPSREVFDSKLGHNVADPHVATGDAQPHPSIAGTATVLRSARASTRDEAAMDGAAAGAEARAMRPGTAQGLEQKPETAAATSNDAGPLLDQLARWRARAGEPAPASPAGPPAPTPAIPPAQVSAASQLAAGPLPVPVGGAVTAGTWRAALVRWAESSPAASRAAPALAPALSQVLTRLALPAQAAPVLQLLYAAHLRGIPSLAPSELVAALDGEEAWREALAAGALGACGAVRLRRSRLTLAAEVRRFLDERPVKHGVLVGSQTAPPPDQALTYVWDPAAESTPRAVGEALASRLGCPVLSVSAPPLDPGELARVCLEARLRGAVVALPYPWLMPLSPGPLVYVAPSRYEAESTELPILSSEA